jgi:hypothetical protein
VAAEDPLLAARRSWWRWAPEIAWTAIAVAGLLVGFASSEGEPVCEGPFILSVNDSSPPACGSPLEALPFVVGYWLVGLVVVAAVHGLVIAATRAARP